MIKTLLQLGAVLAMTLFLWSSTPANEMFQPTVGKPEIAVLNWYMDYEMFYLSPLLAERAVLLAEQIYRSGQVRSGLLTFLVAPFGIMQDNIYAYYDYRTQTIMINPTNFLKLDLTYTLYVLAHEVGHHFLRNADVNDHCLMYDEYDDNPGFDHQLLRLLGVPENEHDTYIDPFMVMMVCNSAEDL